MYYLFSIFQLSYWSRRDVHYIHIVANSFYVNFFVFKSEGAKESFEEKEEPLWKDGNKKQMSPQKLIFFR